MTDLSDAGLMGSPEDRAIVGEGTPIGVWESWPSWDLMPHRTAAQLVHPDQRLVVIAPHPDDEVLAAGGLLHAVTALRRDVLVIAVTDGTASHPGSTRWPAAELGAHRTRERTEALCELGIIGNPTVRLGYADGHVAERQASLGSALDRLIGPDDVVVMPWLFDGHPDHEAVARAVLEAGCQAVAILQAPIWGWHWAHPADERLPLDSAVVLDLDAEGIAAKRRAIQRYRSQLEPDESTGNPPILPAWALARFDRPREVFLTG